LVEVYLRFKEVDIPADLHIYSAAGHGFVVRPNAQGVVGAWLVRFGDGLGDRGSLGKQ